MGKCLRTCVLSTGQKYNVYSVTYVGKLTIKKGTLWGKHTVIDRLLQLKFLSVVN